MYLFLDKDNVVIEKSVSYIDRGDGYYRLDGRLDIPPQLVSEIVEVDETVYSSCNIGLTKYENGEVVPYQAEIDRIREEAVEEYKKQISNA